MTSLAAGRGSGVDWLGVALELLAIGSIPLAFAVLAADGETEASLLIALPLVGVGSGSGWLHAGRNKVALAVTTARWLTVMVTTFAFFGYSLQYVGCERSTCGTTNPVVSAALMVAWISACALIPIASAAVLAVVSARRGAEN